MFVKNGERHRAHLDTLGYLGRPYYTLEQCRITEDGEGVKGWMGRSEVVLGSDDVALADAPPDDAAY